MFKLCHICKGFINCLDIIILPEFLNCSACTPVTVLILVAWFLLCINICFFYHLANFLELFCGLYIWLRESIHYNMLLCLHTFLVTQDQAMAHALSCWFLTAEDQIQYQGSPHQIMSDKVAQGKDFIWLLQLPHVIIMPAIFTFHSPYTDNTYHFSRRQCH